MILFGQIFHLPKATGLRMDKRYDMQIEIVFVIKRNTELCLKLRGFEDYYSRSEEQKRRDLCRFWQLGSDAV